MRARPVPASSTVARRSNPSSPSVRSGVTFIRAKLHAFIGFVSFFPFLRTVQPAPLDCQPALTIYKDAVTMFSTPPPNPVYLAAPTQTPARHSVPGQRALSGLPRESTSRDGNH